MTASRPLDESLEELVLGAPRRFTRLQVAEAAGLAPEETHGLWRALGFPEVGDEDVLFTQRDVDAARLMASLGDAGVLAPEVREAVARAVAQSMARLAEWQVGMVRRVVESQTETESRGESGAGATERSLELAAAVVPAFEELQTYVWRRHLAATIQRFFVTSAPEDSDRWPLVVGFADMVGFTRTTRKRSTGELSEMIERFGAATTDVIADGRGRVVKTVGDEVLFVADEIADGARIALALRDRVRTEPALPQLRIFR